MIRLAFPLSFIIFVMLVPTGMLAQGYVAGNVYFGQNEYIEYHAGNLPIIISAPHGGSIAPTDIPDRTCGTLGLDTRTQTLIREIEYEIFQLTGGYPHIIINRLSRDKIDVNRDIDEATCGNAEAVPYWEEWHKFIDSAEAIVVRDWAKGLYIDLHAHGHTIQRQEWGYLLSSDDLVSTDATLNLPSYVERSSIRTLAGSNLNNLTHAQLIRGATSIGTMLANLGIPSVPSSQIPSPGSDPYFSGGYNTQRHGSMDGGTIDGVQIETSSSVRIDHNARLDFSNKLASVVLEYLKEHYFPQLEDFYTFDITDTGISIESFSVPYEQDFDDVFAGDQTHYYSDNDPQFPGMYSFRTLENTQPQEFRQYTVGTSTTGNGYFFNAGHSDAPVDRALGMIYSSTTGPVAIGLRFVNNTGAEIKSLTVGYTGEQWRVGGDAGPPVVVTENVLEFEYMIDDRATNIRNGEYVSVPTLNFISPNTNPAYLQTSVNGNLSSNRRVLSETFNVSIPAGSEVMLKWIDRTNDDGFDHLLAVDDLSVTAWSTAVGIDDREADVRKVLIYPNPTSGLIQFDNPEAGMSVAEVYDLAGVCKLRQEVSEGAVNIDVAALHQGIYILVLRSGRVITHAGKFIRQ